MASLPSCRIAIIPRLFSKFCKKLSAGSGHLYILWSTGKVTWFRQQKLAIELVFDFHRNFERFSSAMVLY